MAAILVKINNPNQSNTKEKGNLLSAHFIDLNFRANIGISATNKNENITPNPSMINGLETIGCIIPETSITIGKSGKR